MRYYLYRRQRRIQGQLMTAIGTSLAELQNQIQNQREDLYILESILAERGLIENGDISNGRHRLIDSPRQRLAERENILTQHEIRPEQLIPTDDEIEFQ
jgi:hypothetical protein